MQEGKSWWDLENGQQEVKLKKAGRKKKDNVCESKEEYRVELIKKTEKESK